MGCVFAINPDVKTLSEEVYQEIVEKYREVLAE